MAIAAIFNAVANSMVTGVGALVHNPAIHIWKGTAEIFEAHGDNNHDHADISAISVRDLHLRVVLNRSRRSLKLVVPVAIDQARAPNSGMPELSAPSARNTSPPTSD